MFPHELIEERKEPMIHKKISNSFIQSAITNSTLASLKTIWYIAKEIEMLDFDKEIHSISIDTKDMINTTGLTSQTIRNNLKKMNETSITFIDENKKIESFINLLPQIDINYGKNTIDIKILSKIAKLIIAVVDNYTFVDIKQLMRLKNKHSIRLLPLLKTISEYTTVKQKTLSLQDFNALFGTKYKRYTQIINEILVKTKEELDNNSSITFIYDTQMEVLAKGRPSIIGITIKPIVKTSYQSTIFTNDITTEEPSLIELPTTDKLYKTKQQLQREHILKTLKYNEILDDSIAAGGDPLTVKGHMEKFISYCIDGNKNHYKDYYESYYNYIEIAQQRGWTI